MLQGRREILSFSSWCLFCCTTSSRFWDPFPALVIFFFLSPWCCCSPDGRWFGRNEWPSESSRDSLGPSLFPSIPLSLPHFPSLSFSFLFFSPLISYLWVEQDLGSRLLSAAAKFVVCVSNKEHVLSNPFPSLLPSKLCVSLSFLSLYLLSILMCYPSLFPFFSLLLPFS